MTNFENTNFVELTDKEMMETEGGGIWMFIVAHPYVSGAIVGSVAAVGTAVAGALRN